MNETEKTEAVIAAPLTRKGIQAWAERRDRLESHARDLARKLDIVMGLLDPPSPGFNWPEYKTELARQARAAWERTE